jgi:hypothetical protein
VRKHGTDGKRRVWRKLHLAVDTDTHEIIAAELALSGVTDAEVLPNLLKQTRRTINANQIYVLSYANHCDENVILNMGLSQYKPACISINYWHTLHA